MKPIVMVLLVGLGFGVVVAAILSSDTGDQPIFELSETQIFDLVSGSRFEAEGDFDITPPGARNPCRPFWDILFDPEGTIRIDQGCMDEAGQVQFTEAAGTWQVSKERLCLDAKPILNRPTCYAVEHGPAGYEFRNAGGSLVWTAVMTEHPRYSDRAQLLESLMTLGR